MNIPSIFDDIRPLEPEELQNAYDELFADEQFKAVVARLYPDVPLKAVEQKVRMCGTNLDFQKTFIYGFLENLLSKVSTGCDINVESIDTSRCYTFMSNHRDIVLDSALLSKLMIDSGFSDTCEIGIGDNLLTIPWVRNLVRINKAFTVKRGLHPRERIKETLILSQYMHFAMGEKRQSIWIAQRQGRAKDSNDETQGAILKMMSKGGKGKALENLREMNIVPLSISYEYDPCDYLKAVEMQQKRDNPDFKKGPMDDAISMKTGILGYKGRIHYHCAPCINDFLETLAADVPAQDMFNDIARHIDKEIHSNYMLYTGNYVAMDFLDGTDNASQYTEAQKKAFFDYVELQLSKVSLPNADMPFLKRAIIDMYAWPARNYLRAAYKKNS